jgi:ring-1,2-phenylacetyl-CoA epoxidase subunit PaaD
MVTAIQAIDKFFLERSQIGKLLNDVADPEIPVVSIVDLGMVIDIRNTDDKWQIDLAPTYTGCPAIDVIPFLVKSKLDASGFPDADVRMILSPPWGTEWISEAGKDKLHAYGIAPPDKKSRSIDDAGSPACCPQCGSTNTELISSFGSTPCKAAYKCLDCAEPFDYFKCY